MTILFAIINVIVMFVNIIMFTILANMIRVNYIHKDEGSSDDSDSYLESIIRKITNRS